MRKSLTVILVAVMLVVFASCLDSARRVAAAEEPFTEAFPHPVAQDVAYI